MKVKGDLRFGSSAADGQINRLYPEQESALIDLTPSPLEAGRLWYVNGESRFAYDDGNEIQVIPNMNDLGGGGGGGTEGVYTFNRFVEKDIPSEDNYFYIDIPATVINANDGGGFVSTFNTLDSLSFKLTAVIDMTDTGGGGGPSSALTVDYVDGKVRMLTEFTYGDDGAAITLPYTPVELPTNRRVLILSDVNYEEVDDGGGGFEYAVRLSFLVRTPAGWTVPDECTLKGTMIFTSYGYDAS